MQTAPRTFRWSRVAYDRAAEAGAFIDQRVELIRGAIVEMTPMGSRRAALGEGVRDALAAAFQGSVHVRTEKPLALGEWDEPQPDAAVVAGGWRDYLPAHPTVEQTLLVVEIGDSTLTYDLGEKARIYAAARVGDYWVIDPNGGEVTVCREPVRDANSDTGWDFARRQVARRGQMVTPLNAGARPIAIADLLP